MKSPRLPLALRRLLLLPVLPPSLLPVLFPILIIGAVTAAACSPVERAGEGGGAALQRNLLRTHAIEIVAERAPVREALRAAADRLAKTRGCSCRVLAPSDRGDPHAVRIVVGGPGDPFTTFFVGGLGAVIGMKDHRPFFAFQHATFGGGSDALVAVFEDPDRPGLPLTVVYANHPAVLVRCAASIEPGWKPWARIYRAGELSLEGPLTEKGSIDESFLVDVEGARAKATSEYEASPVRSDGIRVRSAKGVDPAQRDAYLEAVVRARAETARWTGAPPESHQLELVLHARPENLELCAPSGALSSWNPTRNEVHALLARGVPHDGGLAAARALAEDVLDPPAASWLADGAAGSGAGSWWGRELEEWVAWLRLGGLAPSVAAIIDSQAVETNSPHAILPLRAALFRYLLESRGEARVRDLWKGTAQLAVDVELERAFASWLDEIAARHRSALEAKRLARRASLFAAEGGRGSFLAAVGIEEPGRSARRGFGSAAYEQSLVEARAIGANTAALHCFLPAERDPIAVPDLRPDPLDGARAFGPFGGDVRVFAGLCSAHASGLRTILAPHLLTAPAGTLAGTGAQGDENGWRKFFDVYARFAVHTGLLAELADADGFVLGGGMSESTTGTVEGGESAATVAAWRREGWSKVIHVARGAFPGTMTWAAASMLEANALPFWDQLDAVACDLEPELDARGLGFDTKPALEIGKRISAQLSQLANLAATHDKPYLLSQAGFRSGATRPRERRDVGFVNDPGLQVLQIDALAKELHSSGNPGALAGVILWRWSSDPADEGVNGRDRLLRRGPAREAAARVFAGW